MKRITYFYLLLVSATVFLLPQTLSASVSSLLVEIPGIRPGKWYTLTHRMKRDSPIGYVDGKTAVSCVSALYSKGVVRLMATMKKERVCTPYFDNLLVRLLGRTSLSSSLSLKQRSYSKSYKNIYAKTNYSLLGCTTGYAESCPNHSRRSYDGLELVEHLQGAY